MAQVIRTPLANEDVIGIWDYIASDNVTAADKLVRQIDDVYEQLARNPKIGSKQEQYGLGMRAFAVGNYIIFYHEIDDGIEIYRVLHGARNLDELL